MLDSALTLPLNHLLQGAEWARARLRPFAGRSVRFEIPPLRISLALGEDACFVPHPDDTTDVVVRLPADTPFLLLQGLDGVMAAAHVEGNAEFATELSFVLRHLRWDAEEDLSRLVGDIAAHRLVQGANGLIAWQRQAGGNLTANLAEYFAHEHALLIARPEFEAWRADIAALCGRLDRLEGRVRSLPGT
jgi:ubiquinone biosynthesis protein UbiJ